MSPVSLPEEIPFSKQAWGSAHSYVVAGLISSLLLIGGVGAWAALAEISGAVLGVGVVGVKGQIKTVQHLDGGIVQQINVENGTRVQVGDVLISLDPTELKASLAITGNRLLESYLERDRLVAERDDLPDPVFTKEVHALNIPESVVGAVLQSQNNLFQARKSTRVGEIGQLDKRVRKLKEEITGYRNVQMARSEQLELINEELDGLKVLYEKGLVAKPRVMSLRREAVSLEGQIAELGASMASARSQVAETELQKLQVTRIFYEKVLADLKEVSVQLNELLEQKHAQEKQLERVDIRAPVSGVVHDLKIHTVGGVISPAAPLLEIIPVEENLIIETQITPDGVDQVYPGQDVFVNFPALHQKTSPELSGQVIGISGNRLINELTGMPYYMVLVEIPEKEKRLLGIELLPGMPADVFIQTQERSVLSYLLKPLTNQINKAFREE